MNDKLVDETTEEDIESDQTIDTELDEETPEIEEWQKEDESDTDEYQVDGKLHQAMKSKLKGRVSDRDETIERLRAERDALKMVKPKEEVKVLTRPKKDDFNTDEEFELELSKYDAQLAEETYNRNQAKRNTEADQIKAKQALDEAVSEHYERADKLIEESGIKPDRYKTADATVRKAVEVISPKLGDVIVDQVISILGKGSEKVIYYLGVNKPALNKFQSLMASDPSGMKAAVYLGQEKQRLTNPSKPLSTAPAPASELKGDAPTGNAEKKLKKAYDSAKSPQAAYDAKKAARKSGVDTSKW